MRSLALALAAALVAAPAAAQEDRAPAYEVAGSPQQCIRQSSVRSYVPIDARTLYVRMKGSTDYVSALPQDCEYKPKVEALVSKQVTSQVCANEIVQRVILQDNIYRGFCRFGPFTPVKQVKTP